jgi:predicted AlkP superfamily phosphohydrolase/phosphomutase
MFDRFIEDENVELYTQIFYFTDRVQHMMWRLRDPKHPRYDAEKAALYAHSIADSYETMDRIVGKALAKVNEHTHLIVVSDHGFVTWRRSVNLNTWLARNGYMTLTGEGAEQDLEALFDKGSFWPNVDWSRTKAFALGLGYVYLNVLGREPEGIVLPGEEYDRVCQAIARGLEGFVDPATGLRPVSKVYRRDEIYRTGFDPDLIPDLRVCNTPGYRVSWQSSLGNTPKEILYDNDKNWSADHCSVDPVFVDGILLTSFPLSRDEAWIGDIFPTICDLMDLDTPDGLHGRSLIGSETASLSGSGDP